MLVGIGPAESARPIPQQSTFNFAFSNACSDTREMHAP